MCASFVPRVYSVLDADAWGIILIHTHPLPFSYTGAWAQQPTKHTTSARTHVVAIFSLAHNFSIHPCGGDIDTQLQHALAKFTQVGTRDVFAFARKESGYNFFGVLAGPNWQ